MQSLPLGIMAEETYPDATYELVPGDQIVFYTDGVTEAENLAGEQFGLKRLDETLENCSIAAPDSCKCCGASKNSPRASRSSTTARCSWRKSPKSGRTRESSDSA